MSDAPCIRYLRDYIAIPSVNPMRRSDIPAEIIGEARYADWLQEQLRRLQLDVERVGDPRRPSLIAEARVPGAKQTVLCASHLDTVPVDGMQIDPFDPQIKDGRVFGRGACDTKAGMAALVAALEQVLARGTLRCNVQLVGEADEELESLGARAVLQHLEARRPDWVLATEPTGLRMVTRHKGVAHARLLAHGVAAHAAQPNRGENAIFRLARAALAMEALATRLVESGPGGAGHATLSVGTIEGGSAPNVVPAEASLMLDRRFLAHEDQEEIRAQIGQALDQPELEQVTLDWLRIEKLPLATNEDQACVQRCRQALSNAGLDVRSDQAFFGTDAGIFSRHGIPSLVLGPGSIDQAHTENEWVEADQVSRMSEICVALFENG